MHGGGGAVFFHMFLSICICECIKVRILFRYFTWGLLFKDDSLGGPFIPYRTPASWVYQSAINQTLIHFGEPDVEPSSWSVYSSIIFHWAGFAVFFSFSFSCFRFSTSCPTSFHHFRYCPSLDFQSGSQGQMSMSILKKGGIARERT